MAVAWVLLLAGLAPVVESRATSPVSEVVNLIRELKATIEGEAATEQKSYDKFACWCEKTLERKAKDIADAKVKIEELQATILELTSKTAAQAVDVKQLEKDINATKAAMEDATALREKEAAEYQEEKVESEQCIGALEAAVNALTGAGSKKGLLQGAHEAQLLSVAGSVKSLLENTQLQTVTSAKNLDLVRRFVEHPEAFAGWGRSEGFLQADSNSPFGDYAPQSSQIQGILKGMYDSFTHSLEKANGEEAGKQKAYEAYIETKTKELETLEEAHLQLTTRQAEMVKELADSKVELEDTKAQLEADEKFFAATKKTCKEKAAEWAERSRMRTMEVQGINQAIEILTSPEAQKTFEASSATFLQLKSVPTVSKRSAASRKAYARLQKLAAQYGSLGLAQIAVAVTTGGHFDEVIVMIDKMIEDLRAEDKDDIAHRDRCQTKTAKNQNDGEDLEADIEKAESELGRLQDDEAAAAKELEEVTQQINTTKGEMEERLGIRNGESDEHIQALKDDADAVKLLEQAIAALTKFYEDNKLPLGLLAMKKEPEYTVDEDKAPETSWKGSYGGSSGESGGIIAILSMLKEDIEADMASSRGGDAEAQKKYLEDYMAMKETLEAQEASKITLEKKVAALKSEISGLETTIDQKKADLEENKKMAEALETDCAWVETHFESRAEKRKKEIEGLQEAKNILAGAEAQEEE